MTCRNFASLGLRAKPYDQGCSWALLVSLYAANTLVRVDLSLGHI